VVPAAGALLLAALLLRAAGPAPSSVPAPPAPSAAVVEPVVSGYSPVPPPARDVFRYGDAPAAAPAAGLPSIRPVEPPPALAPPVPDPVRLVGLVRRSGSLQAALSIHGEVVVLSVGESSGGYQLLEIDEDQGATVRDPEGRPLRLPLPVS
jgi:hypothetical protein